MTLRVTGFVAIFALLAMAGCTDVFEQVRKKDTAAVYQRFISKYPDHPKVEEARRLEAEAALRELGRDPTVYQLAFYLKRYPDSPTADQVRMRILEMKMDVFRRNWDIREIEKLIRGCDDPALGQRLAEAKDYMVSSEKALKKLQPAFFETYLRKNPGGDFADHARKMIDWMKAAEVKPQKRVPVALKGFFSEDAREYISFLFHRISVAPQFEERLAGPKSQEGKIAYRITELMPGSSKQFYNDRGELVEFTAGVSGAVVEIITFADGKVKPIWAWGTARDRGISALNFPAISWNTRNAIVAERKGDSIYGQIDDFGKYLLVTTVDGFELYDPTFPDHLRPVYRYSRPKGARGNGGASRPKLARSGRLLALFGDGAELLDCHSLRKIKANTSATFERVGQVTSGTFVGERFFFTSASGGLLEVDMDSTEPKVHGYGEYDFVTSRGPFLIASSENGVSFYRVGREGGLGERHAIPFSEYPDDFSAGIR